MMGENSMQRFLIAAIAVGTLGIAVGVKAAPRAAEAAGNTAALKEAVLSARDASYLQGKVALVADVPARWSE